MFKESLELHRQGRLDEAERGYRTILDGNPDDAQALHMLGVLHCQRGDDEGGERLLARAHALAPQNATIELSLAALHFRAGDHDAARRGFEHALWLDPNLGGAHVGLGQIAMLRGERTAAEQHFRVALRAGEEPQALGGLGAMLLERGDVEAALRHLARAADLTPDDPIVHLLLGRAFALRDTPAFAEQAFSNALRLRADLHHARLGLAQVLHQTRRFDEAAAQYRALLAAPDMAVAAHTGLADVARAEGRFADAVADYRTALEIEPLRAEAVLALAWSLVQLGRVDEALGAYDAFLARLPGQRQVLLARTDLLMLANRLPEAAESGERLLAADPSDLDARRRLATLSELLDRFDDARAHADFVLEKQPDDADMQLIRIRSQLLRGEDAGARATLEQLSRIGLSDNQRRLASHYRGCLHDRAGETAEAVRCFAAAQDAAPAAMPPLEEPQPQLATALAETVDAPWPQAPVLLLGAPGSGVERIAALLADQPQLAVLGDRGGAALRDDDFNRPHFAGYCGDLSEGDREELRERYLAPLRSAGVPTGRTVVDWLPRWDAHLLALIRRAMPGTRLVIVERDPRDELLNWLAFGFVAGFPCTDPLACADWLARARTHLHHADGLDEPRRLVVDADAVLADPAGAGKELARFLGLDALRPAAQSALAAHGRGGLPNHFAPGHWRHYADALAGPFRLLA